MNMIIPEFLDKEIRGADIIVFEGFEMTGKSTLAREVESRYKPSFLYRPNWEEVLTTSVISRGNRHIPGIAIVDSWGDMILDGIIPGETKLLLDRWMAVSVVYQQMYSQETDSASPEKLAEAFKMCARDLKVIFIHKNHGSIEEAKKMYEITTSTSSEHADIYDKFGSFEDYYKAYLHFEECYEKFYSSPLNPFPVFKVSSLTNNPSDGGITNASRNLQ